MSKILYGATYYYNLGLNIPESGYTWNFPTDKLTNDILPYLSNVNTTPDLFVLTFGVNATNAGGNESTVFVSMVLSNPIGSLKGNALINAVETFKYLRNGKPVELLANIAMLYQTVNGKPQLSAQILFKKLSGEGNTLPVSQIRLTKI